MVNCTRENTRTLIGDQPVERPPKVFDGAIVTEDEDSINVDLDGDGEIDAEIPK